MHHGGVTKSVQLPNARKYDQLVGISFQGKFPARKLSGNPFTFSEISCAMLLAGLTVEMNSRLAGFLFVWLTVNR